MFAGYLVVFILGFLFSLFAGSIFVENHIMNNDAKDLEIRTLTRDLIHTEEQLREVREQADIMIKSAGNHDASYWG